MGKSDSRRIHKRFDKSFPVMVDSELLGETKAVARNISDGGMLIEMAFPLPLGTLVTVRFKMPNSVDSLAATAEVKHQYCYNYSVEDEPSLARGIGLRFIEFIEESSGAGEGNPLRQRILH